ncbi:MAG: hypothetical protein AAFS11_06190, partial [Planctomycetota bacterium]
KKKVRRSSGRRPSSSSSGGSGLESMSSAALQAELARRQRQASSLLKKRDRLREQLAQIESEIAEMGATAVVGVEPGRKRARNSESLVEAMQRVLAGTELTVTELSEAVQAAGYVTTSPNFRTIVNQTLIKYPKTFKRVARGLYTAK